MAYQILLWPVTSSDLQIISLTANRLIVQYLIQSCNSWVLVLQLQTSFFC